MCDLHTTHHRRLSVNGAAPSGKRCHPLLVLVQLAVWGRDESKYLPLIGQGPLSSYKFWIPRVQKLDRKLDERLLLLK